MSSELKFNCIFCKDVFDTKEELQVHFRKHGDPKFNQKNRSRFPNESKMSGEKPTDNVEMVGCDVCSEVFPTISKAITHKHKVHPDHDAKHFCPWCGKLFTMKHLYNKHMQSNHSGVERSDDKDFHCDVCDVDFFVPAAVGYHNKFFHRQETDLPDIGQSKKFKLHNQESVIPLFYCAFCGEEYDNKVNLFKHMTDDHGDENQSPDEVLRCPLCEAIFYHLDAYEIHITFHTSEDLYITKNEEYSDLQEFSLESLPPMVEKVENLEPQEDAETAINSVGIDKFLELAMDQSQDAAVKVKKHKKHKKSKKSAITLDEFLNMNKDVFGEGLDFQGIEEVPTRVVTKRLKTNKKATNPNAKVVTPLELQKLKQQGIVIKKKVSQGPKVHGIKVLKSIPPANPAIVTKPSTLNKIKQDGSINTSDDMLSKLMNQSNNAIKIFKKNTQESTKQETEQVTNTVADVNESTENVETIKNNASVNESNKEDNLEETEDENNVAHGTENNDNNPCTDDQETLSLKPILDTSCSQKITANEDNIHSDDAKVSDDDTSPSLGLPNSRKSTKPFKVPNVLHNKTQVINKIKISPSFTKINNESEDDNCENEDVAHDDADTKVVDKQEDTDKDRTPNTPKTKSLSALKHLSHLITIKQLNQPTAATSLKEMLEGTDEEVCSDANFKTTMAIPATSIKKIPINKKSVDKDPTLDALKNLSKNITIKSFPKPIMKNNKCTTDDNDSHTEDEHETDKESSSKLVLSSNEIKNPIIKNTKCITNESKLVNSFSLEKNNMEKSLSVPKINTPSPDNIIKNKNANILKRLPNITTKAVNSKKVEQIVCMPTISRRIVPPQNDSEIEIFNIDDSDDEDVSKRNETPASQRCETFKSPIKNISAKSINQQIVEQNIKVENNTPSDEELQDEDHHDFTDESDGEVNAFKTEKIEVIKTCSQKISKRSLSINNALKNLGKNITVKSRNSSPSLSVKSQDHSSQDSRCNANEANDSDSNPGNVKITELDDHASDDEVDPNSSVQTLTKAIVQSPDDSLSDDNEEMEDFENQIHAVKLAKCQNNSNQNPQLINSLKSLGNITIKSLTDQVDKEDKLKCGQNSSDVPTNLKKQVSVKMKQPQPNDNVVNRNSNNVARTEHSANHRVSTANQVNSVNKEVTVKTFQTQTQTVIQEITTTVTKTIKTVNQTMKQEIRNSSQALPVRGQKIQGMRQNPGQNLQGVIVRHASPIGTKIGNPGAQIRPAGSGTFIRPSKQIVPSRPGLNVARPSAPRLPAIRKQNPTISPQKCMMGKPLKISPNAITSSSKRPNSDDVTGPFSCFKKPKESLIPVSELPNFSGEFTAQQASSSHTSTSNFTSTTKIVKGNSVVTSTQMKSEISASAQKVSKLNNNSGFKIVKSTQAKQMQTQEKSESNSVKNNTLAAIEKLQKQGLLVKKPRIDVNEDSEHSEPDDENAGCSSGEEHE